MPDLKHFSFEELSEIIQSATTLREAMRQEAMDKMAAEFAEKAGAMGFGVEEILKAQRRIKREPKGSVAAKYANPKDASQTWAGRGKKPKWLTEALEQGATVEQFAIASE